MVYQLHVAAYLRRPGSESQVTLERSLTLVPNSETSWPRVIKLGRYVLRRVVYTVSLLLIGYPSDERNHCLI